MEAVGGRRDTGCRIRDARYGMRDAGLSRPDSLQSPGGTPLSPKDQAIVVAPVGLMLTEATCAPRTGKDRLMFLIRPEKV
jgi:hypothetical protein